MYKTFKELGGNIGWNNFQKLYSKLSKQDIIVRPEDILCLSQCNDESCIDTNVSFEDLDDVPEGVKKVDLDKLDDISMYINM